MAKKIIMILVIQWSIP